MSGKMSSFAGFYDAADFAYGINPKVAPLQVINGPNATGAGALTLALGYTNLPDGTILSPLNVNAPVTVGGNSNVETVTPTAVSNPTPTQYSTPSVSATFTYAHGNGDQIRSGTVGLQEALNFASGKGGGIVIISAGWALLGGTSAIISAVTIPTNVDIWDNRQGNFPGSFTTSLTSAQIDAMFTTPVELLPAPGANSFYEVTKAVFYTSTGTSYTGGGAIKVGYGTTAAADGLAADPAATLLTGTQPGLATEAGATLASNTSASYLNQGLYITNATAVFAAGTSTLFVTLNYSIVTV